MSDPFEGKFFIYFLAEDSYEFLMGKVISWVSDELLLVEVSGGKNTALFLADMKTAAQWSYFDTEQEWRDSASLIWPELKKERQSRRADESKP